MMLRLVAAGFVTGEVMTRTAWLTKTTVIVVALIVLPGPGIASARNPARRWTCATAAQEPGPQRTVWDGVYTDQQAQRGARAYQQHCSRCHREDLKGEAKAPSLVGAPFFDRWSNLSVHDLFFAIQITMSHSHELFAPSEKVADVVSFVFRANKMPAGADELPVNEAKLRQILITGKPATQ